RAGAAGSGPTEVLSSDTSLVRLRGRADAILPERWQTTEAASRLGTLSTPDSQRPHIRNGRSRRRFRPHHAARSDFDASLRGTMVLAAAARRTSVPLISAALCSVILLARVPAMTFPTELNPDEGQLLASAMRIGVDGLPWRGFDGTTTGPVNGWAMFLLHRMGVPLSFTAAHAIAAAVLALVGVMTLLTLDPIVDRTGAIAGVVAYSLFIVCSQAPNFTHLSSELVPSLIAALAVLLASRGARGQRPAQLYLAALFAGLLPWAKLQ